jgi:DNA-binding beta-propeller fold protein YncE
MKRLLLTLTVYAVCTAPQALSQKLLTTIPIAGRPGHIAVNATTNMIYVPNETLNTLDVINGSSNQLVTSVPLEGTPFAAAADAATNMVYVTVPNSSVVVVSGATNALIATIATTAPPSWIAVNPTTDLIYFSTSSNGNGAVGIIDGAANQIVGTLPLLTGCCSGSIAVNTTTNRIYVADNSSSKQLAVIDGNTNKVRTFTIPGVCDFGYVAADSTLNRIYVADDACSGLYVINAATEKSVAFVLPHYFGPIGVNSTNHQVADFSLSLLSFVSGRSGATVGGNVNFPQSQQPVDIATGGHNRYYISLYGSSGSGIGVVSGPMK